MRLINTLALLAGLAALAPGRAPAQTVDPAARAALPDAIRQSGVLKAATSLQWPPFDFTGPDGKPDGLDIKLVRALAERLGLMAEFTDVKFPAIVPGVSTGRFDIGVDQLNDTPDRRRTVQFVDYYNGGYGLLTRQGAPATDVSHLCGHTLALTQGSAQVAMAEQVSAGCTKAGDQPVAMLYFPNSADTYLAVANGRGDGFLTDEAVGLYIAQHNDRLVMQHGRLPGVSAAAGIVVGKNDAALASALRLALRSLAQDGTYQAILGQYGVADMALGPQELDAPP